MKIRIANSLLKSVGIGWPRSMEERLWTIEALVLRYCIGVEEFFDKALNSTLRVNPMLVTSAIKSIVEGQGIKEVRVAYATIKSKSKPTRYKFWVNYKLPGSTHWVLLKPSILVYR